MARKLRKKKRNGTAEPTSPPAVDLDALRSSVSEVPPAVVSKVLLAEVENVKHDPYKHTEEIKVD